MDITQAFMSKVLVLNCIWSWCPFRLVTSLKTRPIKCVANLLLILPKDFFVFVIIMFYCSFWRENCLWFKRQYRAPSIYWMFFEDEWLTLTKREKSREKGGKWKPACLIAPSQLSLILLAILCVGSLSFV